MTDELTAQERFAALADSMGPPLLKLAETWTRLGNAMTAAMRKTAEDWPPERILASAVAEYNRRMNEFNHRGDPDSA